MTKHIDRLMSRASVAAMAAFAPKPEPASTIPPFAERVDEAEPGEGDGGDQIDGLSPEEQAQFDAARDGRDIPAERDAADGDGADGAEDGVDAAGDGDTDRSEPAGDRDPAEPPAADGARPAPKTISYGKYQRELAKANKAAADLQARLDGAAQETAKEREQRMRLDERTKMLLEAISGAKPAAPAAAPVDEDPEPDAETDPIGNLQWQNRRLAKRVEDLSGGVEKQRLQTDAEREEAAVMTAYSADLERAAGEDATFADAFAHLRETRYRELGFIYANIDVNDPEQCKRLAPEDQARLSQNIQRAFYNEQMMVARASLQAGRRPAEAVRNLAMARMFTPKAAPAPAAPAAPAPGAPPAPPAKPSIKDELQSLREGLGDARSLSDAGGSPGGTITPERIANMTDDEFQEFYDSMPKQKLDRIMGKVPM